MQTNRGKYYGILKIPYFTFIPHQAWNFHFRLAPKSFSLPIFLGEDSMIIFKNEFILTEILIYLNLPNFSPNFYISLRK